MLLAISRISRQYYCSSNIFKETTSFTMKTWRSKLLQPCRVMKHSITCSHSIIFLSFNSYRRHLRSILCNKSILMNPSNPISLEESIHFASACRETDVGVWKTCKKGLQAGRTAPLRVLEILSSSVVARQPSPSTETVNLTIFRRTGRQCQCHSRS